MWKVIFSIVVVLSSLTDVYCQGVDTNTTADNSTDFSTIDFSTQGIDNNTTDLNNETVIDVVPSWSTCLAEGAGNATVDDSTIVSIFLSWCRDYKRVIPCLEEGLPLTEEENALDFFISLNFNAETLKKRSKDICKRVSLISDRILCAVNSSVAEAGRCTRRFRSSLRHIFAAYNEGVPRKSLKGLTCDLTHETTRCLDKTLPSCDDDVRHFLLMYYALFTAKKCVYKPSDPNLADASAEPITTKCAKESSKLATMDGPVPTSNRDIVVRGMKADCQTYEARFKCYERELKNPEHFWDRWLRSTFDLQNALEGHREMCPRIDDTIALLTDECFNQSESAIMACENDFTAQGDMIRHAEKERNLTDSVVSSMACRVTAGKADCYKEAFSSCNNVLADVMAHNIISLLPTECRDKTVPGSNVKGSEKMADTKALPDAAAAANDATAEKQTTASDGSAVNKASKL